MLKVNHVETSGWEAAIRGMRNPLNSWDKSDSKITNLKIKIGPNDLDLMKRLAKAGTEHRKYLRMIHVQMDVTAPDYWFKEFSTYRVGVTENSTSTMHRIHAKEFVLDDFSHDQLSSYGEKALRQTINVLNMARTDYLSTKAKQDWYTMIQLLPMSYNYTRTIDMNYENALNMIRQRSNHKLDEWHVFCDALKGLPYMEELLDVNRA